MTAGQTTMLMSNADGAVVDLGYVFMDQSNSPLTAELIQVTAKTPGATNTTLTVTRSFNGTTATTHATNAIFVVVGTPVQANSDLGIDMSRSPGVKSNLIESFRRDVNISANMLALAQHGLVPGIPNMLGYQLHQRFLELLADMNRSLIFSIGTPAGTSTDYQTWWGLLSWFGMMQVNANATAVTLNANNAYLSDFLINQVVLNIYNQGGEVPDAFAANPIVIDRAARIYRDMFRISQDEIIRGYFVDAFRTSLGTKPIRMIMDGYMPAPTPPATSPPPIALFLSLDRISLVPFLDQLCYLISAPSFRDGDAISVLAKLTIEPRNTGTDFGYTGQALYNFSL
jgi:hypothetical protein